MATTALRTRRPGNTTPTATRTTRMTAKRTASSCVVNQPRQSPLAHTVEHGAIPRYRPPVHAGRLLFTTALGVVSTAPTARAQTGATSTTVSWVAPAACPSEAELVAKVEGFLGEPLATQRAQKLTLRARVAGASDRGFTAELRFSGAQGSQVRTLTHEDCASLAEASALVIAIAIDPERVKAEAIRNQAHSEPATTPSEATAPAAPKQGAPQSPPDSVEPPPQPPAVTASAPPTTSSAPTTTVPSPQPPPDPPAPAPFANDRDDNRPRQSERDTTLELAPNAALLIGGGMLPGVGTGVGLGFGGESRHVRVAALGHYWFERSQPVTAGAPPAVAMTILLSGLL
jgi:hypothetical protein